MNKLLRIACVAVLVSSLAAPAGAQQKAAPEAARPRAEPQATTVVNPDRTITFRLKAPEATSLVVQIQTPPKNTTVVLQKGENGVWTGTTATPLAPDIYFYYLVMDGLDIHDPAARYFKGQGPKWGCILEIKGDRPGDYEFQPAIPHGAVTHEWIKSTVLGETRGVNIYTPPSYLESSKTYPVLYLLHGIGGDEETWVKAAFIDRLLDSWIAKGIINELVVVITSNRVSRGAGTAVASPLNDYFAKDVMPQVEKRYRVKTGRENTAVAGFSMGGGQTLSLAFGLPERFGALACLSGAIGRGGGSPADQYPLLRDPAKVNRLFPVFHVACGENDGLVNAARKLHDELDQAGIKHTFTTGPGDHAMKTDWRMLGAFLREFTRAR